MRFVVVVVCSQIAIFFRSKQSIDVLYAPRLIDIHGNSSRYILDFMHATHTEKKRIEDTKNGQQIFVHVPNWHRISSHVELLNYQRDPI